VADLLACEDDQMLRIIVTYAEDDVRGFR